MCNIGVSRSELICVHEQASSTLQSIKAKRASIDQWSKQEFLEEPALTTSSATTSSENTSSRLTSRKEVLDSLPGPIIRLLVEPYTLSCSYFELIELGRKVVAPHAQSMPRANLLVHTRLQESPSPAPTACHRWSLWAYPAFSPRVATSSSSSRRSSPSSRLASSRKSTRITRAL